LRKSHRFDSCAVFGRTGHSFLPVLCVCPSAGPAHGCARINEPVYSHLSKDGISQKATELVFAANLYLLIIT
jgi:hypothetical protein